jgi:hypothetical protein
MGYDGRFNGIIFCTFIRYFRSKIKTKAGFSFVFSPLNRTFACKDTKLKAQEKEVVLFFAP